MFFRLIYGGGLSQWNTIIYSVYQNINIALDFESSLFYPFPPPPPPQPSPTEVVTSQDNTVKFSLEILNPHIAPFVIRLRMLGIIDNK